MRKTKIICTIGPASENEATLTKMCLAGMNVARLNFSHGTHEDHKANIELLKRVRESLNLPIAILLDTKGPEYRIKTFKNGKIFLNDGDKFTFTAEDVIGDETIVSVNYPDLPKELSVGDTILLNNGLLPLAQGAKVSTLSVNSVDLTYGGTGSGNVDASKADSLKVALEKSGLEVNPTLWDFYTTGEGSKYSRDAGAGETAALMGSFNIGEAPWSVYTQPVKDSIAQYGDAAIVTISRIGGEGADAKFTYLQLDQNEKDMMAAAAQSIFDGLQQLVHTDACTSRNGNDVLANGNIHRLDQVTFIVGLQHRGAGLCQLGNEIIHNRDMLFPVGIGAVDHMQQQIRVFQFLKCCPEGIHQMVRQLRNKSYRI